MKITRYYSLLLLFWVFPQSLLATSTVTIDSSWISAQGESPFLLDQADTTYTLATDITTENTAFLILNKNIILDLNGHTVTYNQCTPTTVPNGGFESGSGTTVPNWNLSAAPSAALATNTTYLFDSQVLRFTNIAAKETILSDPVTIPRADHTYVAMITPGNQAEYRTELTLRVVDHVTNIVLAYGVSSNTERGFSAIAEFKPQTTNAIRLEIDVDPQTTTTIDLDDARVVSAYDSGIIAAQQWSGDLHAMANINTTVATNYNNVRSTIENFTLQNGTITQGTGTGYKSSPLEFAGIHGLLVDTVTVNTNGPDTTTLHASSLARLAAATTYNATIRGCTFNHTIDLVANRMHGPSVIAISGNCDILVENNILRDGPQMGIQGGNDAAFTYIVRNNDIRNTAVVVNAYAISLVGIQNFDIHDNTIITLNGRGILVDGYTSAATENGRIYNNIVEIQESGNREYLDNVTARALRIRNNVDASGPHRNLHIYNNQFTATTSSGQAQAAYAGRFSWTNQNGAMNDANIIIQGNTFTAIAYDASLTAKAFVLDGASPGINTIIRNNVFESNDTSLKILDSDGGDTHDTDFISNLIQPSTAGASLPYQAIDIGYWIYQADTVRLIDMHYDSGTTTGIAWSGSGLKEIHEGWLLNCLIMDETGAPLENAQITITDNTNTITQNAQSDHFGFSEVAVTTRVYSQFSTAPSDIQTRSSNPLSISVSLDGYLSETRTFSINESQHQTFNLIRDPAIVYSESLPDNHIIRYPNPAKDTVQFLFAKNLTGPISIRIFNMHGEQVAQLSETVSDYQPRLTWDAKPLAAGIYIYIITQDKRLLKKGKVCLID